MVLREYRDTRVCSCKAFSDAAAFIGGAIVYGKQLKIAKRLGTQRGKRFLQMPFLIIDGQNDADFRHSALSFAATGT